MKYFVNEIKGNYGTVSYGYGKIIIFMPENVLHVHVHVL